MLRKTDSIQTFTDPAESQPAGLADEETAPVDRRGTVSRILQEAGKNPEVIDQILPLVYEELHSIASRSLLKEREQHTLSATALVHEAYLRLCGTEATPYRGSRHFFAAAAVAMRRVLVDHARRQKAQKRIPRWQVVDLDDIPQISRALDLDVLALNEALDALGELDQRKVKVVELRYFAGLSEQQTADVLDVSPATVRRSWAAARVWLRRKMSR